MSAMNFMDDLIGSIDIVDRSKEIKKIEPIEPQPGSLAFLLDDIEWMDYDAVVDHFAEVVDCRSASLYANALLELGDLAYFEEGVYDVCRVKSGDSINRVIWDHEHGFWVEVK
ncbi:hypothetical protein [Aeromonas rivipollensis]|uniref:hypothetical protein n=1 Tax=Aeromonas rivipollensis TaxID=948519 RepID=UPI003D1CA473